MAEESFAAAHRPVDVDEIVRAMARPVVMSNPSTILIRPLPMYRNWDGSLSFTWSGFGSGSLAASRATSPNESFRPVGR